MPPLGEETTAAGEQIIGQRGERYSLLRLVQKSGNDVAVFMQPLLRISFSTNVLLQDNPRYYSTRMPFFCLFVFE